MSDEEQRGLKNATEEFSTEEEASRHEEYARVPRNERIRNTK